MSNDNLDILKDLYSQDRTLLGPGMRKTLDYLKKYIDLKIHSVPTGTNLGSWKVPLCWRLISGEITSLDGEPILSKEEISNQIWAYSQSFQGKIKTKELHSHLTLPKDEPHIPVSVAYYSKTWGLSVSNEQFERLMENDVVNIQIYTDLTEDSLDIGYLDLPGYSSDTILVDCITSFSKLANNLSGIIGAVNLARYLSAKKNYFSYRFLFTPETIGPIAIAHTKPDLLNSTIGGVTLINLAKGDCLNFKLSRSNENTFINKCVNAFQSFIDKTAKIGDYSLEIDSSCNEKTYNSPGIEIDICRVSGLVPGSYPEYDTLSDNIDFISENDLNENIGKLISFFELIDNSANYVCKHKGEPFLSGLGFDFIFKNSRARLLVDAILNYADGKHNLLDVCSMQELSYQDAYPLFKQLLANNLIEYTDLKN